MAKRITVPRQGKTPLGFDENRAYDMLSGMRPQRNGSMHNDATGRIRMGIIRSVVPSSITVTVALAALGAAPVKTAMATADAAAGPGGEALQEIVVTATRRSEDLQNVGLSITALTTEQLESKGVEQFFDYGNSVPNLSFAIDAADGSLAARGIALRGIQGANTTGFYIDDT